MEEPPNKKTKANFDRSATSLISIGYLPREILCIIFAYLDKRSVQHATATCKLWFELIRGDSNLSSHICFKIVQLSKLEVYRMYQNVKLTGARWPVLKKVEFVDNAMYRCHSCNHEPCAYIYRADFIETYSRRLVDPKECSTLEEIIISATYCLKKTLPEFSHLLNGTIKELTFSVKDDLKSIQAKHVTSLSLRMNLYWPFEKTLKNALKLIGNTAHNLKDLYVKFDTTVPGVPQETIEDFQKSFCQMLISLAKSLQRVQIKVDKLYYINTLLPNLDELTDLYVMDTQLADFQRFLSLYPAKLCLQFKNLRTFYMDVNVSHHWSQLEDDWIKLRLPQVIDEMFQGIKDVKIHFNRRMGYSYFKETVFTVTKEANQTTEVHLSQNLHLKKT